MMISVISQPDSGEPLAPLATTWARANREQLIDPVRSRCVMGS
jgi:hypothetical protein